MAYVKDVTISESETAYWATQALDYDATLTTSAADLLGCSRVTVKWNRVTPTGTREDQVMTSIWVAKIVGGHLYSMIPVTELAAMETKLNTFFTWFMANVDTEFTLVEYAWHQVNESSPRTDDAEHRGQKMGPATRVTVRSVGGGVSGTRLPDQVAENITLRTSSRKHWGRMYMPGVSATLLDVNGGRWLSGFVDQCVSNFKTLHDGWQTDGYQIGVWSQLHPAFLTPKAIEADDIPDIQRRRRPKQAAYRKIG